VANGTIPPTKIKPGGFILLARKIWKGKIADYPPHYREIWIYLLFAANHRDIEYKGRIIKRGQCILSYKNVIKGLGWYVGFRKEYYKKHQYDNAMKWFRKEGMITTARTVRGALITICNYDYYQSLENYESSTDYRTINKKEKELKDKTHVCFFDSLWKKYPPRNGTRKFKSEAYDYFSVNFSPAQFPLLEAAVKNYAGCADTRRGIGIMDMIRFLRPKRRGKKNSPAPWTEWVNNPDNRAGNSGNSEHEDECQKNMRELEARDAEFIKKVRGLKAGNA